MNLEEKKNNIEWYDNPSIITWLIILIISRRVMLKISDKYKFRILNNKYIFDILECK